MASNSPCDLHGRPGFEVASERQACGDPHLPTLRRHHTPATLSTPLAQILLGLNHMHSKKILHRDIKTLNVFLDDNLNVKLGDMGVAKVGGGTREQHSVWPHALRLLWGQPRASHQLGRCTMSVSGWVVTQ